MNVTLYSRVSTTHQDVDQQMRELRKWAIRNEHRIVGEIWDTESGAKPLMDRAKFKEMLDNPRGDAIVVFNLDRLSRYWYDEPELERYFTRDQTPDLISMHDEINLKNASGRAMFRMKMMMNCYMPEDMLEKQKIGIARAKAEGKFKGRQKGAKGKAKQSKEDMLNITNTEVNKYEIWLKSSSNINPKREVNK